MNAAALPLNLLPADAQWPALPDAVAAIPTQTPAWVRARAALLPPDAACFIAVHDGAGLAALAPLLRSGRWLREPPALFEPSDWLWRSPQALAELALAVARLGLPLQLDRLPLASPTLGALRQAFGGRALVQLRPAMPTPVIELDERWREPEAGFDARRRADFRRYERRAAAHGRLSFELHAPPPGAALQPLLDQAYAVEARSWKARRRTALSADPVQGGFFVRFAQAAAAAGMLRIAFMRLDGQAVAMQIAAQWRQRFWLFKISHDEAFDACSPGQLLMRHTLLHAAHEGLLSYEFMGGMDPWTRLWTRQLRHYQQVQVLPVGLASAQVLARRAAGRAARAARAAVHRLRRWAL